MVGYDVKPGSERIPARYLALAGLVLAGAASANPAAPAPTGALSHLPQEVRTSVGQMYAEEAPGSAALDQRLDFDAVYRDDPAAAGRVAGRSFNVGPRSNWWSYAEAVRQEQTRMGLKPMSHEAIRDAIAAANPGNPAISGNTYHHSNDPNNPMVINVPGMHEMYRAQGVELEAGVVDAYEERLSDARDQRLATLAAEHYPDQFQQAQQAAQQASVQPLDLSSGGGSGAGALFGQSRDDFSNSGESFKQGFRELGAGAENLRRGTVEWTREKAAGARDWTGRQLGRARDWTGEKVDQAKDWTGTQARRVGGAALGVARHVATADQIIPDVTPFSSVTPVGAPRETLKDTLGGLSEDQTFGTHLRNLRDGGLTALRQSNDVVLQTPKRVANAVVDTPGAFLNGSMVRSRDAGRDFAQASQRAQDGLRGARDALATEGSFGSQVGGAARALAGGAVGALAETRQGAWRAVTAPLGGIGNAASTAWARFKGE